MPLLLAAAAIVALVALIVRVRMHAFPALMIVTLGLGLGAGLDATAIATAFQTGVGNTLGFIAVVIGLGTFVGALLAESGGAALVARAAVGVVGDRYLPWVVAAVGFVIGLPIFFSVGLVLLFPVVVGLAATAGRPLLTLALPLVAGLSASHGLVAPHPGPLVAISRLGADTGLSIRLRPRRRHPGIRDCGAAVSPAAVAVPAVARWGADSGFRVGRSGSPAWRRRHVVRGAAADRVDAGRHDGDRAHTRRRGDGPGCARPALHPVRRLAERLAAHRDAGRQLRLRYASWARWRSTAGDRRAFAVSHRQRAAHRRRRRRVRARAR